VVRRAAEADRRTARQRDLDVVSSEQSRLDNYRRVLNSLHKARHVEYHRPTGMVTISPLGERYVEERILPVR
jgi:hypothetical protein